MNNLWFLHILLLLYSLSLQAKTIDPNASSLFSQQFSEDTTYILTESYPLLSTIIIKPEADKISALQLLGRFPALKKIAIRGTSSDFLTELKGDFPILSYIDIAFTSGNYDLNLNTKWCQDVKIQIQGTSGNVLLDLPQNSNIQLTIHTTSGKIINQRGISSVWSFSGKKFEQFIQKTAPTLYIEVEVTSGEVRLQ